MDRSTALVKGMPWIDPPMVMMGWYISQAVLIRVLWELNCQSVVTRNNTKYVISYHFCFISNHQSSDLICQNYPACSVVFTPTLMVIWWHWLNNDTVSTQGRMIYSWNRIFKAKTFPGFIKHIFTLLIKRNHWHLQSTSTLYTVFYPLVSGGGQGSLRSEVLSTRCNILN